MVSDKLSKIVPNLILMTILTVLLLVPPLTSMVLIFGSDQELFRRNHKQNILGLKIAASPEAFGNNLRYLAGLDGTVKTVGFSSKPGESVLYKDIYELRNITSQIQTYEIEILKVWGSNVETKKIALYFGQDEERTSVSLYPGQKTTVNLKVTDTNFSSDTVDYNYLKFVIF